MTATIPPQLTDDVRTLWDFHQMGHQLRPTDVGIGLGSHDLGVAIHTANLWHAGMFPLIVFTGANAPTTVERFPRGEAVHYREHAMSRGVPNSAILIEPEATHTGANIELTRDLLAQRGITVGSVTLISRPYQQRRAYSTCRQLWPEVEVLCSSLPMPLDEYVATIGDADRVISMMVGDTQRLGLYAHYGYATPEPLTPEVEAAYERLIAAGYGGRLIPT